MVGAFFRGRAVQQGLLLAICLSACGEATPTTDAATDALDDSAFMVTRAELPAPPAMTPCPVGFREVEASAGVMVCDPVPLGGIPDCPDGSAWFVGESGCINVGAPCPAGEFAEGLPETGVIYISANTTVRGDGSRTSPYRSLNDIASLSRGATIALSKGIHIGLAILPEAVEVIGACVAETSIASPILRDNEGVFTIRAGAVAIRNLTIARSERPAVVALGDAASVTVEGVVIEAPRLAGVLGIASTVTLRDVVVRDVRLALRFSRGVDIEGGATLAAERVTIHGESTLGGLYVGDTASTAVISDLAIYDVGTRGVSVEAGAAATVTRAFIEGPKLVGVFIAGEGSSMTMSDIVIRDVLGEAALGGRAIEAYGARLSLERFWVDGAEEAGAVVFGGLGVLTMRDGVVQRVDGLMQAFGALSIDGGRMEFERVLIADVGKAAIALGVGDGAASLRDVTIRRVRPEASTGRFGRGVDLASGVSVGERVLVEDALDVGVSIGGVGTVATLGDLIVRRVDSEGTTGQRGLGVSLQRGASLDAHRIVVEDVRQVGFLSVQDADATLADLVVQGVAGPRCAESERFCPVPMGVGVVVGQSTVNISRFSLDGARDCGFQIGRGGLINASDGIVRGSAIGACVQVDGYDVRTISRSVRYEDNGSSLQATSLRVPEPVESVDTL